MIMKVLIIEDEKPLAQGLLSILENCGRDIQVIGTAANIADAVDLIRSCPELQLIFADIRIEDGYSFDVFSAVSTNALIVFTTAYEEYALKAFDYDCIDYVMKPYDMADIVSALEKYERRILHTGVDDARRAMDYLRGRPAQYRQRLELHRADSTRIVDTQEICYIEYELGSIRVFCNDKFSGCVDKSLSRLYEELNPDIFFKVSRNYIINISQVDRIRPTLKRNKLIQLKAPYQNVQIEVGMESVKALKGKLL